MKWINYHFSQLKDKRWFLILSLIFLILWVLFFYLGGGFEHKLERILHLETYIYEYEQETFTLLNLLMAFFIINMSRDIFLLDEPHILLIHKPKYIVSKMITYLMYYLLMILIAYGVYQVMYVILFGFHRFNYTYIIHLMLNAFLIHGITILILGQGKAILKTIVILMLFLLLDRLVYLSHPYFEIMHFFYPIKTLNYPNLGYLHSVLYLLILYTLSYHKHLNIYT